MNRRAFLSTLVGGTAATAAVRTWPFRVFSFPEKIVVPKLILRVGDIVQFNQVFQVNPRTRQETPFLKSFVITENVFARGSEDIEIPIHPSLYRDGVYQNCAAPENFKPKIQNFFSVTQPSKMMPLADFRAIYPDFAFHDKS